MDIPSAQPTMTQVSTHSVADELQGRLNAPHSAWPTINGHRADQIPFVSADGPIVLEFLAFAVEFNNCLKQTRTDSGGSQCLKERGRQALIDLLSRKEALNREHAVIGVYVECQLDDGLITDLRYTSPTAMATLTQPTKLPTLRITI